MMMERGALFSPDRTYRYVLTRRWEDSYRGWAMFIGLNPSTADENLDDPTIRRCVAYAQSWGYSGLSMLNLFAFRATKPADMMQAEDPVGPENDQLLQSWSKIASVVIAAWGNHGSFRNRDAHVSALIPCLHVLRCNKDGSPAHPLYLPKTLAPRPWNDAIDDSLPLPSFLLRGDT
jgi:hypothetical protein